MLSLFVKANADAAIFFPAFLAPLVFQDSDTSKMGQHAAGGDCPSVRPSGDLISCMVAVWSLVSRSVAVRARKRLGQVITSEKLKW